MVAVGHRTQDGHFICDALRGRAPPFDTKAAVAEFAKLLDDYGLREITGDNYSAAWVQDAFKAEGVKYTVSELTKSELYIESLPLWTRGGIIIPDHARLLRGFVCSSGERADPAATASITGNPAATTMRMR